MKTNRILFILLVFLGLSLQAHSQHYQGQQITKIRIRYAAPKQPVYKLKPGDCPPGTIKVKDYYIDTHEMTNIGWLEFLHYRKQEVDSVAYKALLPDSTNTWYTLKEYRFAPLVSITYEQALEYCKWRSVVVSKNFNRKITYRLPTPAEWEEIAKEQLAANEKKNKKELQKTLKLIAKHPDNFLYIPIHKKEKKGVFHLFDNVSEMTSDKGVAKGANNSQLTGIETNLNKVFAYDSAGLYLGFRCIAEME